MPKRVIPADSEDDDPIPAAPLTAPRPLATTAPPSEDGKKRPLKQTKRTANEQTRESKPTKRTAKRQKRESNVKEEERIHNICDVWLLGAFALSVRYIPPSSLPTAWYPLLHGGASIDLPSSLCRPSKTWQEVPQALCFCFSSSSGPSSMVCY